MASRRPGAGRRRATAALAAAIVGATPAPAEAQICLDCFTVTLGANPFAAPVVLPGQALFTGTLGLAGPFDRASLLPNLLAKVGLTDGVEAVATLGYEPSLGTRVVLGTAGTATLLAAGRVGFSYFRSEWLVEAALPLLLDAGGGWSLRLQPQFTVNRLTGNHLALEATAARLIAPGTSLALTAAPDYRLAEQVWSGAVTLAASRSLTPRWAAYALGSLYLIDGATPLVAMGLTYLPQPVD